tara:strand:- start:90 stop:278 length:189 start_codon:yes stop_codon:yes gene_type:complete
MLHFIELIITNALVIKKFQTIYGANINKIFFELKNKFYKKLNFFQGINNLDNKTIYKISLTI